MCFHSSQTKKIVELENRFKVSLHDKKLRNIFNIPAFHLNGFAHPKMLIIPQEEPSILLQGKWGIVPSNKTPDQISNYYKEAVKFGGGLNAQSEKLFYHFIYRNSALTRRCLIPVTGFFEPHEHNKKKYPFHIKRKDDEAFALAGIYTLIGDLVTFTILTKEASPLFAKIHNVKKRQPILIEQSYENEWLSDNLNNSDIKELINHHYPEEELKAYAVSKDLFNPRIDSDVESIIDEVIDDEFCL